MNKLTFMKNTYQKADLSATSGEWWVRAMTPFL